MAKSKQSITKQYDNTVIRKAMKATSTMKDFKAAAVSKVLKELGIDETPKMLRAMRGRMVYIGAVLDADK